MLHYQECAALNGLKLMNLNEMALKVHPEILQHDQIFKDSSVAMVEYCKPCLKKKRQSINIKR